MCLGSFWSQLQVKLKKAANFFITIHLFPAYQQPINNKISHIKESVIFVGWLVCCWLIGLLVGCLVVSLHPRFFASSLPCLRSASLLAFLPACLPTYLLPCLSASLLDWLGCLSMSVPSFDQIYLVKTITIMSENWTTTPCNISNQCRYLDKAICSGYQVIKHVLYSRMDILNSGVALPHLVCCDVYSRAGLLATWY